MNDDRLYFIRPTAVLDQVDLPGTREPNTVRRSLNGDLCVLVYAPGEAPGDWKDGMTVEQVREVLQGPEGLGVWYTDEFQT